MKWKELNREVEQQLAWLNSQRARLTACAKKVSDLQTAPSPEPQNKKARSTSEKAGGQ
jgi:hypothetical protein